MKVGNVFKLTAPIHGSFNRKKALLTKHNCKFVQLFLSCSYCRIKYKSKNVSEFLISKS